MDAALLEAQFGIFFADAYEVARSMRLPAIQPLPPDANEEVEAEGDAPPALVEDEEAEEERQLLRTTRFWRELSRSPATADAISEWIKLGQLVLVQVHGSCEDERVFSAMAYLKNKHRNRLQEAHLREHDNDPPFPHDPPPCNPHEHPHDLFMIPIHEHS